MKARLATALSIAGIVVTGGAAFAMNSSILDTDSTAQGSPALATVVALDAATTVVDATTTLPVLPPASSGAVVSASQVAESISATPAQPKPATATKGPEMLKPLALAPDTTSVDRSTPAQPTTTEPSAPSTSPAPAPVVRQFNVEDFASIFLTVNGTQLAIDRVVIVPGSPYSVSNKYVSGDTVRITLSSSARAVEFSARLTNGEIVAAVSDPTSALLPPPRRHDDDDDDDDEEHEEREHDDDHDREDDDD